MGTTDKLSIDDIKSGSKVGEEKNNHFLTDDDTSEEVMTRGEDGDGNEEKEVFKEQLKTL